MPGKFTVITILLASYLSSTIFHDKNGDLQSAQFTETQQACDIMVNAGPDIVICPNQSGTLQGSISGNYNSFRWEPATGLDDPFSLNPTVTTNVPRTYRLIAEGSSGNLIVNGGFENGVIAPSSTGYNYVDPNSFAFAGDGSYTLGNSGTFGNIWGCTPHSGNWAMAINGATAGNVSVWCQTVSVTPNTDHMFEAWIMGVSIPFMPSYADLEFLINGNSLGNLQAPVATCAWDVFMANWNSGVNISATVCIRNLNTSAIGNYCAIDDISLIAKCEREDEVEVTVDQVMAAARDPLPLTCIQNSVILDGTGSSTGPGYTYSWDTNDGEILGPRDRLQARAGAPGRYTLTVTSPAGCSETVDVFVDGNTTPPDIRAFGDTLGCNKPQARLLAESFTPGVSFEWKGPNGFRSGEPDPLVSDPGEYTVIVIDQFGCADSAKVTVESKGSLPDLSVAGDSLRCGVDSVQLEAMTSASGAAFQWKGPGNFSSDSSTISVRDTGWYYISLRDINGCTALDSFFLLSLEKAIPANLSGDTLSCAQSQVTLMITSDSILVSYEWSGPNGFSSALPEPVVRDSGWYYVNYLTGAGCEGRDSIFIPKADDLPLLEITGDTIRCDRPAVTLLTNTDATTFSIQWTGPNGFSSTENGPTVQDTGWYRAVLETPGGCMVIDSVRVSGDLGTPMASFSSDTLDCLDTLGQFLLLNALGNYSYEWTGPGGFRSSDAEPMVRDTGTYQVVVTGNNGCRDTIATRLFASLDLPDLAATGDTLNCLDRTGILEAISGVSGVVYEWTGPNGFTSSIPLIQVSDTGLYRIEVIAPNGCRNRQTVVLEGDFDEPELLSSPVPDTINCRQTSIALQLDLAPGNYQFDWSGPGGFSSNMSSPVISAPGSYSVVITGTNGCSTSATINIEEDTAPPDVMAEGDTITCDRPAGQLTGSSSVNGAIFEWNGPNGFSSTDQSPAVADSGTYELVVTAPNGCIARTTVRVIVDADLPVVQPILPDTITCIKSSVSLVASASGSGLMYQWTSGGIALGAGQQIEIGEPGSYFLEVTNDAGCISRVPFEIAIDTVPPIADLSAAAITCFDPAVMIDNLTHQPGWEYSWTGPGGFSSNEVAPEVTSGGDYQVTITDPVNGCEVVSEVTIDERTDPPTDAVLEIVDTDCQTPSGSLTLLQVTGGNGPYEYSANGGQSFQASPVFSGLRPGAYAIVVRDANGCIFETAASITEQPDVEVTAPGVITLSAGGSGTIDVTTNIPAQDIASIVWSPSDGLSCSDCLNPVVTAIADREYTVTITALNGCFASATVRIEVVREKTFFVPNAFTPNGDGINDVFRPDLLFPADQITIEIFSRWGGMVYRFEGPFSPDAGWDGSGGGKPLLPDVYVYRIVLRSGEETTVITGDVTLIR